jgi:hypothetical protein
VLAAADAPFAASVAPDSSRPHRGCVLFGA